MPISTYRHQNANEFFQHSFHYNKVLNTNFSTVTLFISPFCKILLHHRSAKANQEKKKNLTAQPPKKCTYFTKPQHLFSSAQKQQTFAAPNKKSTTSITVQPPLNYSKRKIIQDRQIKNILRMAKNKRSTSYNP